MPAFSNLVVSNVLSCNRVQVQKCPSSYDTKDKFVIDGLEKETLPCLLKTSGKRKLHMMPRYATLYKGICQLTNCICTCYFLLVMFICLSYTISDISFPIDTSLAAET